MAKDMKIQINVTPEDILGHLKDELIKEFNQDDPDTHPKCYPSFDWAGKSTLISGVYITNVGAGQFVDGRWVTVSYDASDTNKGLAGVTHYLNHKELIG
jgi:hypothetical protein